MLEVLASPSSTEEMRVHKCTKESPRVRVGASGRGPGFFGGVAGPGTHQSTK